MSDFPFKVGDKVRQSLWSDPAEHVTITAVGAAHFLAESPTLGSEHCYGQFAPWELYAPPPVRRRWTFETEDRVPNVDDLYVGALGGITLARYDNGLSWWPVVVPGTLQEVAQR